MRSDSGVTPLTVFTKPWPCGGECIYCPKVDGLPNSYLPRVKLLDIADEFSAYMQTLHWLKKIISRGGLAAKIEVIILGGSFTALPEDYIKCFISGVYHAVEGARCGTYTLEEIIVKHEQSSSPRIIGITIETRPDLIEIGQIRRLFNFGITKVELGVQHLFDKILDFNQRNQPREIVYRAVDILKKCGLKVGFHILFGMPSSSLTIDEKMFDLIFHDDRLQPDHIKIYFCEFFKKEFMQTGIVDLFESNKWKPLNKNERHTLLLRTLPKVPSNVRISRIGRKISKQDVEGTPINISRGYIEKKAICRCIKCREPKRKKLIDKKAIQLKVKIQRVNSKETYIEMTDENGTCYGFLRLRHLGNGTAIVRELHVYGLETEIGDSQNYQHNGIGKHLLYQAEVKAIQRWNVKRILVTSGIGARSYYKKNGYSKGLLGYMQKKINQKEGALNQMTLQRCMSSAPPFSLPLL